MGYKPLKVTDLRDPRIQKAIDEIKKEIPDPEQHNELLQIWGYIERDSQGNYANIQEAHTVLATEEELDAKQKFDDLVTKSQQFTIDPNDISANAFSELLRNLPRNEHVVQKIGCEFKEAAFFNYFFKEEIDDEFVKLFEQYQIFKYLPDFTKYTKKGVDNENHFGEHYCCLINALIQLGCDGSVLLEARTCITGLFLPKSALKEFCDIARIKIKLYWYENNTKKGKKMKNANMWDSTNECLKDAPLFEIGIIDNHHIAYKNTILVNMQLKIMKKLNIKQIGGFHPKNRKKYIMGSVWNASKKGTIFQRNRN